MGDVQVRDKIYIDGAWVPSTGSGTIDVINSTTEEVMGTIPEGTRRRRRQGRQGGQGRVPGVGGHVDARSGASTCSASPRASAPA